MDQLKKFCTGPGLILGAALLCLALPVKAVAQCPWCTTPTTCSLINQSTPIGSCTVDAQNYCTPAPGACVFAKKSVATARDLHLDLSLYRTVEAPAGKVDLAPVGGSRFAAWNCQGELIHLYAEQRGRMVKMNHVPYREEYAYERLVKDAAARMRA